MTEVYTCPHARKDNCNCKKPLPFLVEEAIKKYYLGSKKCYVVGDSGKNDMLLAKNSGI
ncbi:HAD hydrolase-like protein [Desemzia incerta]|uniref:HAD hydrolase-like protein n=1 Tax=Desemzia incerta TaxID=82801 RepID=UPI0033630C20